MQASSPSWEDHIFMDLAFCMAVLMFKQEGPSANCCYKVGKNAIE